MNNNHLVPPIGYKRIRYKKSIDKILLKSNWIILQFVDTFSNKINKLVEAIVVDESNCLDIIEQLPRSKKILIVADNKSKARNIFKICKSKKLRVWILH